MTPSGIEPACEGGVGYVGYIGYVCRWVSPFLQATKALRATRGIALLCCLDLGTRRGWGVNVMPRPCYVCNWDVKFSRMCCGRLTSSGLLCRWVSSSQFRLDPTGDSNTVFQNAEKSYPSTHRNIPKEKYYVIQWSVCVLIRYLYLQFPYSQMLGW
jgi:hypothetical protein